MNISIPFADSYLEHHAPEQKPNADMPSPGTLAGGGQSKRALADAPSGESPTKKKTMMTLVPAWALPADKHWSDVFTAATGAIACH